jgi:hypothetical protein
MELGIKLNKSVYHLSAGAPGIGRADVGVLSHSQSPLIVGDRHQRIYHRHEAALSRSGIDIRGRARKLYLSYRTTDEICRQAEAQLEGIGVDDLDDGTNDNSLSHGPASIMELYLAWEGLVTCVKAGADFLLFATRHRAKGLEFQHVIVTSTKVGRGVRREIALQLIYVALTRAKQRAALLTAC